MRRVLIVIMATIVLFITGCELPETNTPPTIQVEDDLYVDVHDENFDLEDYVTISDTTDGTISLLPSMVDDGGFDVSIVGNYDVIINVRDSGGASAVAEITIHVEDLIAPEISLNGMLNQTLFIGDDYTELGATVTDNYDTDLEYDIEGSVDTSVVGVYTLDYYAVDSSDNMSETLSRTVTVIAHEPVILLDTIVATHFGVTFNLTETDPNNVSDITEISLWWGIVQVQTLTDLNVREFHDLLSDTTYTLRVTSTYDLGDGSGPQTVVTSQDFITLAYTEPITSIHTITPTKDSATFQVAYTDADGIGEISTIELYQGSTLISTLSNLDVREFTGLLSNTNYTIRVTTTFDLQDGSGVQSRTDSQSFVTLAYTAPTLSIINVNATTDAIQFDLNLQDPDQIGNITSISLYQDETQIETTTDDTVREFTTLLSGNAYTISVSYEYDLHDGTNVTSRETTYSVFTISLEPPTISLSNVNLSVDTLTFDLTEDDPFEIGLIQSIELIEDDTIIQSLSDLSLRSFVGLSPGHVYTVRVNYEYDMNDGTEVVSERVLARWELKDSGLTVNGDFSNTPNALLSWDTGGWAGLADVTESIVNEELVLDITDSGDEFYAIQYTFADFELQANREYVLSFEARSSIDRFIDISVGIRPSPIEWTGIAHTSIPLTSEMASYEFTFTPTYDVTEFAQIVFELGASLQGDGTYLETPVHTLVFDNITVYERYDITDDVEQVYSWFSLVRDENGLHTSSVPGSVYSLYDNALAAIVYTMLADYEYAADIFDYFDARIESELQDEWGGFAQIRGLNDDFGPIGNRWLGDNAWLLIAIHYYQEQTGTTEYQELAEALETWIMSLQNEDGGLSSGYDPTGFMTYPVTEGMIDAYNAIPGFTTFHQELQNYLLQTRVDDVYGVFMAWPGHPTYQYSLDTIGWGYLGMDGWSDQILTVADQLFRFEENGIEGHSADIDKDTIFTELTMTIAAAYNKAGQLDEADELMDYMDTLFFVIDDQTKGLPYTTSQATGYADFPLWDTVDTEAHLSGNAWYVFAKMRVNPMKTGLEGKDPFPVETVFDPDVTVEERVYNWIKANQLSNGLQASHEVPVMISLYDNALAAIVYTMYGDYARAEQIFDFFNAIVDTELNDAYGGFAQFHDLNGDIVGGAIGKRWLGDNAWLLVAINQYHHETGTNTYSYMATELDAWIRSLQNPDGSLSSGYDEAGTMMGPVTEAMIDSYNAVLGYDDFHRNLLTYLETERYDAVNNVLVSWPDNPTYLYAIDMSSWAYLAMNDMPVSVLAFADQHFLLVEDGVSGYCIDEDLDSIWTEHSLQMAVAYIHAGEGYQDDADFIIQNMEMLMMTSPTIPVASGLPYTTSQATMYGSGPLWEGVDTDIYLSGSAWYLMAVNGYNPFEAGLLNKQATADINDAFYRDTE